MVENRQNLLCVHTWTYICQEQVARQTLACYHCWNFVTRKYYHQFDICKFNQKHLEGLWIYIKQFFGWPKIGTASKKTATLIE